MGELVIRLRVGLIPAGRQVDIVDLEAFDLRRLDAGVPFAAEKRGIASLNRMF